MSPKMSKELAKHRLEQAKENLEEAEILYNAKKFKGANNRAYYSIFHSIKAVLALEPIDFKRHKDVLAYFNQHYLKTEKFPRAISRKITQASKIREDSDYDDEFTAPIMHRIFSPKEWGTWVYDFTGILLRFGLVGIFFFIYKSLFVYFTIGYAVPQYKFLFLGFAPAFIYWAATTFEDKNPEVFDLFRTSKVTDPLDSNRFIQKDKDLAEAIIGFLCGLLIP